MQKQFLFLYTLLSISLITLCGQKLRAQTNIIEGEFLIQFRYKEDISLFCKHFSNIGLKAKRCLSNRMNIWQVTYSYFLNPNGIELLQDIKNDPLVLQAQFNHYIEQRMSHSQPNDPRIAEQWALNNTGQTGGTSDADIDAFEAWNLTTRGTTSTAEQIVIGIIDGGFDLKHEDIPYFKNLNEIPNNLIDDDNNGYVDDYDGWNAYSATGLIVEDDHGTHVAGIAGAKGNNGIGISGINWNTKILPVCGSSNQEAIVIAAYSYLLEMRAIYDESNGRRGAFIVVTNASFGKEKGNPADFPLWCSIFDSLGIYGVLNAGATANSAYDVDVEYDMPTACTSDFLVSVTNTNHKDEKNPAAGFGLVSIDLGAPGTNILSSVPGNAYFEKTGTSMATPLVAGTIALMYAYACPKFMDEYHSNPSAIALKMKQWLLSATDQITALQGITVSGGRLNLYNSLLKVDEYNCTYSKPQISFLTSFINSTEGVVQGTLDCRSYEDIPIKLKISQAPSADAYVQISPYSSSLSSSEYTILTPMPLVFKSGATDTIPFVIRVYDDDEWETGDSIILNFTISDTTGAQVSAFRNTFTLYFQDNDMDPLWLKSTVTFSENWDSGDFISGGWILNNLQKGFANLSVKQGSVTFYYDPEVTNYDVTITTLVIDATSYYKAKIDYVIVIENFDNIAENAISVEYREVDSIPTFWQVLETFSNMGVPALENKIFRRIGQEIPNMGGKKFQIRLRWNGVNSFSINQITADDIRISLLNTIPAETELISINSYIGPQSLSHFYNNGKIIATVENLSNFDYGCTIIEIDRKGISASPFVNSATQKLFADKTLFFQPLNNNPSGNYKISLYFNENEISGWESATQNSRYSINLVQSGGRINNVTPTNPQANGNTNNTGSQTTHLQNENTFIVTALFGNSLMGFGAGNDSLKTNQPEHPTLKTDFQLYPNPSVSGNFSAILRDVNPESIDIYDIYGKKVNFTYELINENCIFVKLNEINKGIYFFSITDENNEQKITKVVNIE